MVRCLCLLLFAAWIFFPVDGQCIQEDTWIPTTFEPGSQLQLFTRWIEVPSDDGFLIFLPSDWELVTATAVRQAYRHLDLDIDRIAQDQYLLSSSRPLRGDIEVILEIVTDDQNAFEEYRVSIAPAVKVGSRYLQQDGSIRYGDMRAHPSSETGTALAFDHLTLPLHVLPQWLVPLSDSHTLEFWIQTTTLNTVVISSWDGSETTPYPIELVVDPHGRMRYYRNTSGRHVTLVTEAPVADGNWHHIALVNNAKTRWTRLYLDGELADSLMDPMAIHTSGPYSATIGGRDHADGIGFVNKFIGQMDNVALWSSSYDQAQIRSMMDQTIPRTDVYYCDFESRDCLKYFDQQNLGDYLVSGGPVIETPDYEFRGLVFDQGVMLTWNSLSSPSASFLIHRSEDGIHFEEIARVDQSLVDHQWSYTDQTPLNQVVFYRLFEDAHGFVSSPLGTIKLGLGAQTPPPVAEILGNYPNPFNPQTIITYEVHEPQHITMSVINLSGLVIATLVDRHHEMGVFEASWDGTELSSGTYFLRLQGRNGVIQTRQILLTK